MTLNGVSQSSEENREKKGDGGYDNNVENDRPLLITSIIGNNYRINNLSLKPDNDLIKLELCLAYQINLLTLLNTAAISCETIPICTQESRPRQWDRSSIWLPVVVYCSQSSTIWSCHIHHPHHLFVGWAGCPERTSCLSPALAIPQHRHTSHPICCRRSWWHAHARLGLIKDNKQRALEPELWVWAQPKHSWWRQREREKDPDYLQSCMQPYNKTHPHQPNADAPIAHQCYLDSAWNRWLPATDARHANWQLCDTNIGCRNR